MINQKELDELTKQIQDGLDQLLGTIAEPIPSEIGSLLRDIKTYYSNIYKAIANNKSDSELEQQIVIFGAAGLRTLSEISDWLPLSKQQKRISFTIEKSIINMLNLLHNDQKNGLKESLETSSIELTETKRRIEDLSNKINIISNKNEQSVHDIESQIKTLRSELSELSAKSEKIKDYINNTIRETNDLYDKAIENLKSKEERAQELLEIISRDSISGSYQQSAAEEKKNADRLRTLSLCFMVIMTLIMAISLWESVSPDFNWQSALFRIAIVMILTIPAAYLAKESSKHRKLQNNHHRVSLELKSVDPYLSSLPTEKRILIKEKLAEKIFMGGARYDMNDNETPINTHEIVTSLINKLDSEKP